MIARLHGHMQKEACRFQKWGRLYPAGDSNSSEQSSSSARSPSTLQRLDTCKRERQQERDNAARDSGRSPPPHASKSPHDAAGNQSRHRSGGGAYNSIYGLGSCVVTRDRPKGERIAAELMESGLAYVNSDIEEDPALALRWNQGVPLRPRDVVVRRQGVRQYQNGVRRLSLERRSDQRFSSYPQLFSKIRKERARRQD
jgi:hypothetical protein